MKKITDNVNDHYDGILTAEDTEALRVFVLKKIAKRQPSQVAFANSYRDVITAISKKEPKLKSQEIAEFIQDRFGASLSLGDRFRRAVSTIVSEARHPAKLKINKSTSLSTAQPRAAAKPRKPKTTPPEQAAALTVQATAAVSPMPAETPSPMSGASSSPQDPVKAQRSEDTAAQDLTMSMDLDVHSPSITRPTLTSAELDGFYSRMKDPRPNESVSPNRGPNPVNGIDTGTADWPAPANEPTQIAQSELPEIIEIGDCQCKVAFTEPTEREGESAANQFFSALTTGDHYDFWLDHLLLNVKAVQRIRDEPNSQRSRVFEEILARYTNKLGQG